MRQCDQCGNPATCKSTPDGLWAYCGECRDQRDTTLVPMGTPLPHYVPMEEFWATLQRKQ